MRHLVSALLACGTAACHAPAPAPHALAAEPTPTPEPAADAGVEEATVQSHPPASTTAPTPLGGPAESTKWSDEVHLQRAQIVATGRLSPKDVEHVVRQHYGAIRLCVDVAPPRALTRMTATFTIGASGAIADGMTMKTEPDDPTLSACVQRRIRNLVFPQRKSGTVAVVCTLTATREEISKSSPAQKKTGQSDTIGESFEMGGLGAQPK